MYTKHKQSLIYIRIWVAFIKGQTDYNCKIIVKRFEKNLFKKSITIGFVCNISGNR